MKNPGNIQSSRSQYNLESPPFALDGPINPTVLRICVDTVLVRDLTPDIIIVTDGFGSAESRTVGVRHHTRSG